MKSIGVQTAVMILAITMLLRTLFPLELIIGKCGVSAVSYLESRAEILAVMGSSLAINGMGKVVVEVFSSFENKLLE